MFKLDSFASRLMFTTIRITAHLPDGKASVGTGFIFHFKVDDTTVVPVLVTNKHVVAGAQTGEFLIHEATTGPDGRRVPAEASRGIVVTSFSHAWIDHPGDVDLCAMPLQQLLQVVRKEGTEMFQTPLDEALLLATEELSDLSAMEDIVMVGYPIGLWDQTNNLPILRRGITASHPAMDFCGQPVGVVDIAVFPGSSGSPVMILNEGSYRTAKALTIGSRIKLLGVLYAGPQFAADGTIDVVQIPTHMIPVARTSIPVHLGYYIKASELLVLKEHVLNTLRNRAGAAPS